MYSFLLYWSSFSWILFYGLMLIAFMMALLSIWLEHKTPFIKPITEIKNLVELMGIRFLHLGVFVYFTGFWLFFPSYLLIEKIIYLTCSLLIEFSWEIYLYCPLTYYELQMYHVKHTDYKTTFHPCIYSIFREHSSIAITTSGIITAMTVGYILLYEYNIPFVCRLLFAIFFYGIFFKSAFQSGRL